MESLFPVQHPGCNCPGLLTPTLVSTALEQSGFQGGLPPPWPLPFPISCGGSIIHPDSHQPVDYAVASGATLVA